MEYTSKEEISQVVDLQRKFFATNTTKSISFRIEALKKLMSALEKNEQLLVVALWKDLHKSYEETFLTEISLVKSEIKNHIHNLRRWARPEKKSSSLTMFPSSSRIIREPLGNVLIISPWNFPLLLLINPLIGAISAGCCAILKPSPYAENITSTLQVIIENTFDKKYIAIAQGHRDINTFLLETKFDFIFFTGSPQLGRIVMEFAAKNLTPVVLELGGKSPCIVDKDANIDIAAKRIAWGKTINAGQICIAPDYLLIHESVKNLFVKSYRKALITLHGNDIKSDKHYARIINKKSYNRIVSYLSNGKIVLGGNYDSKERYIEPTLLEDVPLDSPVMKEEIFGPVLPMITFSNINEIINFVNSRPKPLAFYYFGKKSKAKDIIKRTTSGGICINDTIMHIINNNLPFGGVGNSGIGKYHGKLSFEVFSNQRAVVSTPTWIDLPLRYMPYKFFKLIKKII